MNDLLRSFTNTYDPNIKINHNCEVVGKALDECLKANTMVQKQLMTDDKWTPFNSLYCSCFKRNKYNINKITFNFTDIEYGYNKYVRIIPIKKDSSGMDIEIQLFD